MTSDIALKIINIPNIITCMDRHPVAAFGKAYLRMPMYDVSLLINMPVDTDGFAYILDYLTKGRG